MRRLSGRVDARQANRARATARYAEGLLAALQRHAVRALGAGVVASNALEKALAIVAQVLKAVGRSTHEEAAQRVADPSANVALLVADSPDSARGHEEARTVWRRRDPLHGLESARVNLLLREAVSAILRMPIAGESRFSRTVRERLLRRRCRPTRGVI